MTKREKLPDLPSALIRVALADLRAVEKLKSYVVDMHKYHDANGKCSVCFAGAVMARTLEVPRGQNAAPGRFDIWTANKLRALDEFRKGSVKEGLDCMDVEASKWIPDYVEVGEYEYDKKQFKKDMAKMADVLESQGL